MANSLVKFKNRTDGNGRGKLHWGRSESDGLPFRGDAVPTYTEDEFEQKIARVADPRNGTYNTGVAEENKAYMQVMDGIANGWFQMIYIERWREKTEYHKVYIEWLEYYLEDGSRTPAVGAGEISYGQPYVSKSTD